MGLCTPRQPPPNCPANRTRRSRYACTNGGVKVYGWVRDTATDGRCATVTASSDGGPGWIDMVEACGSGVRENFDWFIPGTRSAQVILRIHDTD